MFKLLTAALLAVALALPGGAQAQSAQSNDKAIIGAIVGIGALAVIASQLSKKDKKDKKVIEPPKPVHHPKPQPGKGKGWDDHGKGRDGHHGKTEVKKALPGACVMTISDRKGDRTEILGKSCVRSSYRDARSLPDRCEVSIRTRHGVEHGYSTSCLRRQGYVIGRR